MAYGCWKKCCLVVGWLLLVVVVAGGRWVGTGDMLTLRILEKNVNKCSNWREHGTNQKRFLLEQAVHIAHGLYHILAR